MFFWGEGGNLLRKPSVLVAQLWCPTLCNTMSHSPPGSSVPGILQARILEWVAIPFSRGSSQPWDQTQVYCTAGGFFTVWASREAQRMLEWVALPFSRGSSQPRGRTWVSCLAGGFLVTVWASREAPEGAQWLSCAIGCICCFQGSWFSVPCSDKELDILLYVRLRIGPVSSWGLPPLYLLEALSFPTSLPESEFAYLPT